MTSILPPIPRFVFTIFEPIALVAGYLSPMLDTTGFVNSQFPLASGSILSPTATDRILALQLGNVYGLLAMVAVGVLYATREAKVVRKFLLACAIADVGHLYVTYAVMYVFSEHLYPFFVTDIRVLSDFFESCTLDHFPMLAIIPGISNTDSENIIQGLHGLRGRAEMESNGVGEYWGYAWTVSCQNVLPLRILGQG